jgi:hypothetical protein
MNQLLLGALIPFVVGVVVFVRVGCRASVRFLLVFPATMGLGMLWAVIPDIPRLFGLRDLYYRLNHEPWTDIFFGHYTIDHMEVSSPLYAVGLVVMMLTLLAMAWWELYQREGSA